ncbi:MAG: hypothetical protein QOF02_2514 [Blastocatellia bacterium]|jgi:hypothetical protein|nr:hypothetical protein [Blastocatellia bacterium]
MKTGNFPPTALAYRTQARQLIKQLRSDSSEQAAAAAEQFRRIRSFSSRTVQQILEARAEVRLKHALAVVALEHGHASWRALKESAETSERPSRVVAEGREMYDRALGAFLNRWFATHEEARASLAEQGGFLLPFDRQFFICEAEGIRTLGLNPDDPDWERIGFDWAQPLDVEAWRRLKEKRERVLQRA